jgi:shikimate kinase
VKPVVLVGLMGSGESTVGALVAQRTGRPFVDVDVAIAARSGKTVRELWEQGGEANCRQLESEEVPGVLRNGTPTVLAVRPGDNRPLLGNRPHDVLAAMAEARSGLYAPAADAIVDTHGRSPEDVADIVVGKLASSPADA